MAGNTRVVPSHLTIGVRVGNNFALKCQNTVFSASASRIGEVVIV